MLKWAGRKYAESAFDNWATLSHQDKIKDLRMLIVDDFGLGIFDAIKDLIPNAVNTINKWINPSLYPLKSKR